VKFQKNCSFKFLRRRINEPTTGRRLNGGGEGFADQLPVAYSIPHIGKLFGPVRSRNIRKVLTHEEYNRELLTEAVPQVIDTDAQYDAVHARFSALVDKGKGRTSEETKLMRLLGLLIQDYDRRHALPL